MKPIKLNTADSGEVFLVPGKQGQGYKVDCWHFQVFLKNLETKQEFLQQRNNETTRKIKEAIDPTPEESRTIKLGFRGDPRKKKN